MTSLTTSPYVGMLFGGVAIVVWFIRMYQGMQRFKSKPTAKPVDRTKPVTLIR